MSFKIHLKGKASTNEVWLDGEQLHPGKSQRVYNHSPDGFNWGYGGSGPAQLALAICLEIYPDADKTDILYAYQGFKFRHIGLLPLGEDFDEWIEVMDFPYYQEYLKNDPPEINEKARTK